MKEFKGKSFEEIYEIISNRNPDVMKCDLIDCSHWIYSQIKNEI